MDDSQGTPEQPTTTLAPRGGEVRQLIERALKAEPDERLRLLEDAHRRDLNDPFAMSYHGMAISTLRGRYQQGIVFCEEAVRRLGPHPDLLVNLAKAYLAARNKREAVRALRRALARTSGEHQSARDELFALGLRRPPVIPFLPRSFFLNKYLGMLRHRLFYRSRDAVDGREPIPAELGKLSGDVEAAQRELTGGDQNP